MLEKAGCNFEEIIPEKDINDFYQIHEALLSGYQRSSFIESATVNFLYFSSFDKTRHSLNVQQNIDQRLIIYLPFETNKTMDKLDLTIAMNGSVGSFPLKLRYGETNMAVIDKNRTKDVKIEYVNDSSLSSQEKGRLHRQILKSQKRVFVIIDIILTKEGRNDIMMDMVATIKKMILDKSRLGEMKNKIRQIIDKKKKMFDEMEKTDDESEDGKKIINILKDEAKGWNLDEEQMNMLNQVCSHLIGEETSVQESKQEDIDF